MSWIVLFLLIGAVMIGIVWDVPRDDVGRRYPAKHDSVGLVHPDPAPHRARAHRHSTLREDQPGGPKHRG